MYDHYTMYLLKHMITVAMPAALPSNAYEMQHFYNHSCWPDGCCPLCDMTYEHSALFGWLLACWLLPFVRYEPSALVSVMKCFCSATAGFLLHAMIRAQGMLIVLVWTANAGPFLLLFLRSTEF
jgi:hypothetical protein